MGIALKMIGLILCMIIGYVLYLTFARTHIGINSHIALAVIILAGFAIFIQFAGSFFT